jgi:hypothetical protein
VQEGHGMAFLVRNLSVLAYANGFTLWHYKAGQDRLDSVAEQTYFDDAADMLAQGDMMMISAADGARVLSVGTGPSASRVLLPVL